MASYLQMGHQTENLVGEAELEGFAGVVLSPMNRNRLQLVGDVRTFRDRGITDIVLDPQLYYPRSGREKLRSHSYFPDDFESADIGDRSWWTAINAGLTEYVRELEVDTVISPTMEPRDWSEEYFAAVAWAADDLSSAVAPDANCLLGLMVPTSRLAGGDFEKRVASVVSDTQAAGYYVVFVSALAPRREYLDTLELTSMLRFVRDLKRTGKAVFVSFTGPEMLLLRACGADMCGTGKYFNLRRFSRGRYEEPAGGGGQLDYWFEHSLLAFLREADLLRTTADFGSMIGAGHSQNGWGDAIREQIRAHPNVAWLRLSWRHYLCWYARTEADLSASTSPTNTVDRWLRDAERAWERLHDADHLMEEPRNDGRWIRPWRIALRDAQRAK